MENRIYTPRSLIKSKWFRLGAPIILAFILASIALFIPITAATKIQVSAPALSGGETISLSLPLGARTVYAAGGITITKTAFPSPAVDQGGRLTYTLIITNATGQDLTDIVVTDTVPANAQCIGSSMEASTPEWAVFPALCENSTTRTARWGLLSLFGDFLPAGQSAVLTYAVVVGAPLIDQSLIENIDYRVVASNTAKTQSFIDVGSIYTTTVNAPEWQISKSVTPTPTVQPGDALTFTLTITNSGHLTTTGSYTITDQLPNNTNYVTGSASPTATFGGGSLTWVLSAPVGISQSITTSFVVTVTRPLSDGTKIVNQTYSITGGTVFSQAFGAPITITVEAPVTMTITKTDDPYDPVLAGDLLTYTLTVTNDTSSKGPAEGVIVTDTLPVSISLVAAGFVSPTTGTTSTNGSIITWTITSPNPIPVGQRVGLTLTIRVDSPLPDGTILTNTYGVSTSNAVTAVAGPAVTTTVVSTPTLQISKVGLPEPVAAGSQLTYTIRYTNTGNADASGVVITDIFPISTSYVSSAGNPTPVSSSTITGGWRWNVPDVPGEGGTGIITLTLAIFSPQPDNTVLTDVVTIEASQPASDTFTATNTILSSPVLSVTKVGLPEPVAAGGQLTYTIRYTNTGNANASGVVITDIFPISTSYVSSAGSPTPVSSTTIPGGWRWDMPDVPGEGGTGLITLTLAVSSPQPDNTVLTNVVTIEASQPASATFTATNTITSTPSLTITKAGLPEPVAAGGQLTYTIRYTNTGNADASGVVITDIFPISTSYVSSAGSPTPVSSSTIPGGWRWNVPDVPGEGGTGLITLTLAISSPQPDNTVLTDVVTIEASEPTSATFTATNTITSTPNLEISKSGPTTVAAGAVLTYTITYTNTGNADATGVVITDTFEGDFSAITATMPATVLTSPLPARVVWNIGFLPADSLPRTQVVTVTLPVSLTEGTVLTNSVIITSAQAVTNSDTITTVVSALRADLQVNKTRVGSGDVLAGGLITYTITITNAGPDTVGALVTDTFPAGAVQSVVSCDACTVIGLNPGVLTWTVTSLAVNTPQNFTLVLRTSSSYSDTLTNTVEITFTDAFSFAIDPDTSNNTFSVTDTVRLPQADLQVSKVRLGSGDVIAGDLITYTVTITSGPGSDTVEAVVTDTFPTAAVQTVVSCSGCSQGSGVLTWTVTGFAANDTQSFTVVLRTASSYSGTLTNTAGITFSTAFSNGLDPDTGNNTASVTDTVRQRQADLQVSKVRLGSGDVIAGDLITYTVTITNGPGSDTVEAVVTDTFPTAAVQTVVSCSGCSQGSGVLTWTVTGFAANDTQSFTVVLRTASSYSGTLTNTAGITFSTAFSNAIDPDTGNNTASVTDTVRQRQADLSVNKAYVGSGDPVVIGQPITYTLTITNAGPDTVTAVVTDTFPSDLSFSSFAIAPPYSSEPCNSIPQRVVCTIAGFTGTTVITIVLDTSGANPGTVLNSVQIMPTIDTLETDNSDNDDFVFAPALRLPEANLGVLKTLVSSNNILVGEPITYTLTISNTGPDTVTAVVTDTFTNASYLTHTIAPPYSGAPCTPGAGQLVCTIANFTGTTVITVVLDTSGSISGTVTNTAEITPANGAVDNVPGNNTSTAPTVTVQGVAQLIITKTGNPSSGQNVRPGQTIIYDLAVTNLSTATIPVTNLILTDTLDLTGVGYVTGSVSPPGNGPFQNGNIITFSVASLGIGASLTATVEVTVTAATSGTIINNSAIVRSNETGNIGPATTTHRVITSTNAIYLPIIMKNFAAGPDLVITSFTISPPNPTFSDTVVVTVVVQNQGNASTGEGFWTDFYVNPSTLPNDTNLGRNRRWDNPAIGSSQGIAWSVPILAAGQVITLTSNGAPGTVGPEPPPLTNWNGQLASGSYSLYAFVDSFDGDDLTGPTNVEIVESDENNNMAGPINVIVPAGLAVDSTGPVTPLPLSPRPDVGN